MQYRHLVAAKAEREPSPAKPDKGLNLRELNLKIGKLRACGMLKPEL